MNWPQITALLRAVCTARKVVGADMWNWRPIPGSVVSEFVAARLAVKLLLYHARGKR